MSAPEEIPDEPLEIGSPTYEVLAAQDPVLKSVEEKPAPRYVQKFTEILPKRGMYLYWGSIESRTEYYATARPDTQNRMGYSFDVIEVSDDRSIHRYHHRKLILNSTGGELLHDSMSDERRQVIGPIAGRIGLVMDRVIDKAKQVYG